MPYVGKYLKQIDDKAREALRGISAAQKDLERAKAVMDSASSSHDERRILNAKAYMLEMQDALKDATKKANAALDSVRGIRSEAVRENVRATSANPEHVDMAGIELIKSGILRPADYAELVQHYKGNPTMLRILGKCAREAGEACSNDDFTARVGFFNAAAQAEAEVNPDVAGGAIDGMLDLFERCVGNPNMIKDYDSLAAGFMN